MGKGFELERRVRRGHYCRALPVEDKARQEWRSGQKLQAITRRKQLLGTARGRLCRFKSLLLRQTKKNTLFWVFFLVLWVKVLNSSAGSGAGITAERFRWKIKRGRNGAAVKSCRRLLAESNFWAPQGGGLPIQISTIQITLPLNSGRVIFVQYYLLYLLNSS